MKTADKLFDGSNAHLLDYEGLSEKLADENVKLRAALQRIATFYDDGESDFSGDTPTIIAKEALEI